MNIGIAACMTRFVLMLLLASTLTTPVAAIEIEMDRGNATSTIIVTGPIEPGDADKLKAYWDEYAYDSFRFVVAFDSPGGSLGEGLEIGEFLRAQKADTTIGRYLPVPEYPGVWRDVGGGECHSACAIAFMGGFNREVPEGAAIGFHQFSGGSPGTAAEVMERSQYVAAHLAGYLRGMGAKSELFELMSKASPSDLFIPTPIQIVDLGIVPANVFSNFQLRPKGGAIVASAANPRNTEGLEYLYEIEATCTGSTPTLNLYGEPNALRLREDQARWFNEANGFRLDGALGSLAFTGGVSVNHSNIHLATLYLDPDAARIIGAGGFWLYVDGGMTANGAFLSGQIDAPHGGDPAIQAVFRQCF